MISTSTVYGRRLLQGITRYLGAHRPWSIFLEQREIDTVPPAWLRTWRGDGVISRWSHPRVAEVIGEIARCAVDVSDRRPPFGPPRIDSDDAAIGRLGAAHLLERGFRSYAYCGFGGELWSTRRRDAFLGAVAGAGHEGGAYESPWREPGAHLREDEQARIGRWLATLPRPVGVMAANDVRGIDVLDACQRFGMKVPEEVAVLGVDDDALLCEVCSPTLSSAIPDIGRIGYEAAALLDRLMAGGAAAGPARSIPPLGVTTRLSTDAPRVDDPHLAAALRFIRENACHGISVGDVLGQVPLSRSTLERRFRAALGRSPQGEIRAVRIARAKQLLAETDHPMHRIAELVGIEHPEYFQVIFKREVGMTPGRFRGENRGPGRT